MKRKIDVREVLEREVKSLPIGNGDLVLIKRDSLPAKYTNIVSQALVNTGRGDCVLIMVDDMDDVATMSRSMLKHLDAALEEE